MAIGVKIFFREEVKAELKDFGQKLQQSVIRDLSALAQNGVEDGAARHTKRSGSGALFQSVYNRAIPNGREVGHDPQRAPHAMFVIFGTRPHIIAPKNKKALRWAGGNGFIFAKFVKHPGYIGDNYLVKAAQDALSQFREIVDQNLKEL